MSLDVCQLFCFNGSLWPQPTNLKFISRINFFKLNPHRIAVFGVDFRIDSGKLLGASIDRFMYNVRSLVGSKATGRGVGLVINFNSSSNYDPKVMKLTLDTPESYTLKIYYLEGDVSIK